MSRPTSLRRSLRLRTSSRARPSRRSSSSSSRSSATAQPPSSASANSSWRSARTSTSSAVRRSPATSMNPSDSSWRCNADPSASASAALHVVDLGPQARPERPEVGHDRPRHQAREGVDVVERLDVELRGDLVERLAPEAGPGCSSSARRSGWRTLTLASVRAARPRATRRRAAPICAASAGSPRTGRQRPVRQVDRHVAGQRHVQLVGEERAERRQQLAGHHQGVVQGGVGVGVVGLPEPGPAAADVPVRQVVDEPGQAGGAAEGVEALERVGDRGHGGVELAQQPAVEHVGRLAGLPAGGGLPAVEVGVGDEEAEDVPQRQQRLAGGLADAFLEHAPGRPRLAGREEVPAQGVGAEAGEDLPGIDDVAPRLRHLLALLVDEEPEAHDVAVGRGAEHQRVDRQQGVEPAPRLVDGLADEVGGEAGLEPPVVGEGVVELGRRHRSRVEPGVEHRREAADRATAAGLGARPRDVVDVGPVQVDVGQVASRQLRELGHRPDAGVRAAAAAAPDRQRRAPVAVARQGPVDVGLQPAPEPAVLDVLGVPGDGLVLGQQVGAPLLGADEPRRLGPVDERGAAAPAVGIAVLVGLLGHQQAAAPEVGDDLGVGVLDEAPLPRRHRVVERGVGVHRVEDRQPLGATHLGVVLPERGRQVDDAGTVVVAHVVGDDDPPSLPATRGGSMKSNGRR